MTPERVGGRITVFVFGLTHFGSFAGRVTGGSATQASQFQLSKLLPLTPKRYDGLSETLDLIVWHLGNAATNSSKNTRMTSHLFFLILSCMRLTVMSFQKSVCRKESGRKGRGVRSFLGKSLVGKGRGKVLKNTTFKTSKPRPE